jgi:hypothetical protein
MKKYWIKRHPILTLLLIMLLPLMLRGGLNYSGFCWAEKRWLSDEERIDAAIEHLIYRDELYLEGAIAGEKVYKVIPYKSVSEFKQKNQNCCAVVYVSDLTHHPILDYILGYTSIWMPEISGIVTYLHNGKKHQVHTRISRGYDGWYLVPMSNCGKILDYSKLLDTRF